MDRAYSTKGGEEECSGSTIPVSYQYICSLYHFVVKNVKY
jgi:hypothetical protein